MTHQLQEFIKLEDINAGQIDLQSLNNAISSNGSIPTTIAVISSVTFNNGTATTNYTIQQVPQTLPATFPVITDPEVAESSAKPEDEALPEDQVQSGKKVLEASEESKITTQNRLRKKKVREKPECTTEENMENCLKMEELDTESCDKLEDLPLDTKEDEESSHLENIEFPNFPKKIIQDTKLLIRGKALISLMSKFYRLECDLCAEGSKR